MKNYDDILYLTRPRSKHPQASIAARASQFTAFAALTGFDKLVDATATAAKTEVEQRNTIDDECIDGYETEW